MTLTVSKHQAANSLREHDQARCGGVRQRVVDCRQRLRRSRGRHETVGNVVTPEDAQQQQHSSVKLADSSVLRLAATHFGETGKRGSTSVDGMEVLSAKRLKT